MKGEHKLKKQVGDRGYYAVVRVDIEPIVSGPKIVFMGKALSQMYGRYEPNAIVDEADLDAEGRAVKWGIEYALQHIPEDCEISDIRVIVEEIMSMVVDTTPGALAFAACYATWDALGIEGQMKPFIGMARIHFPGEEDLPEW